jgi:nitroreductase
MGDFRNIVVNKLKVVVNALDALVVPAFSKSALLSSVYYCFFSRRFRREHQSVLVARVAYWNDLKKVAESTAMLRRNIHRLEKGLIMKPRRTCFAEGYITETVLQYERYSESSFIDKLEWQWAYSVLNLYFDVVEKTKTIKDAYIKFSSIMILHPIVDKQLVPYEHQEIETSGVDIEAFSKLCRQRRSVRWFLDKPVPFDLIRQAVNVASQAPSACNRQPFNFYISKSVKEARELGSIPMGTSGFSQNFQSTVVVLGDLSAYPYERDRHVIYIDASLAVMQLMLALETLGLSSCVINWPDVEILEEKMERALNLKKSQRPIMLVTIGYAEAEGMIPFSHKKSYDKLSDRC